MKSLHYLITVLNIVQRPMYDVRRYQLMIQLSVYSLTIHNRKMSPLWNILGLRQHFERRQAYTSMGHHWPTTGKVSSVHWNSNEETSNRNWDAPHLLFDIRFRERGWVLDWSHKCLGYRDNLWELKISEEGFDACDNLDRQAYIRAINEFTSVLPQKLQFGHGSLELGHHPVLIVNH